MDYRGLATDFDGTLARDGHVAPRALAALGRLKDSGRALVLVTGRQLPELVSTFPELGIFDAIVAENGALLHRPATGEQRTLAAPPPEEFLQAAHRRGIAPFSVGEVVFATWRPHETAVLEIIQELGLELQIVFNKRAVMVLPSGVNKATGLAAALGEMELEASSVVGIGDAENDHAFLEACGLAVAVANALPAVRQRCHLVTRADHGDGVIELIDRWLGDPRWPGRA